MGNVELWLILLGKAMLSLLTQPFFYVSLLLLGFIYTFITRMERAMFATKLQPWLRPFVYSITGGCLAALIVSLIAALLGFTFTVETIWWLWGVSLLLALIRLRLVNIAYSAAIVTLLHLVANIIGPLSLPSYLAKVYSSLLELQPVSLLAVAALLLLVQSALIRWQGKHFVSPIYMSGKRGKIIGGYVLRAYWTTPLLLFMPVVEHSKGAVSFAAHAAQPYFLQAGGGSVWLLLACPLILGAAGMTQSTSPEQLVNRTAKQWALYSILILAISIAAWWVQPLLWVAALGMLICFELVYWLNILNEEKQPPRYGPLNNGLRVLAVVEQSPAVHMGIEAGDTVLKANGQAVNSLAELYEAMSINPAFCKLELLNTAGEIKFAQRARFADEHHQLGIIMAPDNTAKHLENYREPALVTLFGQGKLRRTLPDEKQDLTIML